MPSEQSTINNQQSIGFAPVVSVLGHVDHGKTSLLDKIRETSVASREKGGITQKIGASEVEITHEGKKRKITFIDTPGHAAFDNMRSQGVNAADIVLLIVAADDGVMPQTRESIAKIIEVKIPFIVVFTKIDMDGASIEKAKGSVAKEGILLEGLGGDVPFIGVSSKTGEGIVELLDLVVLIYDLSTSKKDDSKPLMGVVIDAKIDKRRGIVSTIVLKEGKLKISDKIFTHGREVGKIKAIVDPNGVSLKESLCGTAVEVLGLMEVLPAGSVVFDRETELVVVANKLAPTPPADLLAFLKEDDKDIIPVIIKTESAAELEALKNSLPEKVLVIYEGQGEINVSDILMGKDFRALVLGFNVEATREAAELADSEKVFYKSYGIIYQLLEELDSLIGVINQKEGEHEIGKGEILASFLGSSGVIVGIKVTEGRLAVGDRIKIWRAEKELGTSKIISVKRGKEDVKLATKNMECGVMISPEVDFAPQDAIIAYSKSQ